MEGRTGKASHPAFQVSLLIPPAWLGVCASTVDQECFQLFTGHETVSRQMVSKEDLGTEGLGSVVDRVWKPDLRQRLNRGERT